MRLLNYKNQKKKPKFIRYISIFYQKYRNMTMKINEFEFLTLPVSNFTLDESIYFYIVKKIIIYYFKIICKQI